MALGDHLRAHQHIDLARVHLGQLSFSSAPWRGCCRRRCAPRARGCRPALHAVQQGGQLLRAARCPGPGPRCRAAAARAGARYAHGKAAVVAAQAAVGLVEHLVRAAVRAVALPAAVLAVQHRGIARRLSSTMHCSPRAMRSVMAASSGPRTRCAGAGGSCPRGARGATAQRQCGWAWPGAGSDRLRGRPRWAGGWRASLQPRAWPDFRGEAPCSRRATRPGRAGSGRSSCCL